MIKIENFSKKYKNSAPLVIDSISLELKQGVNGLLGLNGQGKTTILKAITGIHYPTKGKIFISDSSGNYFDIAENINEAKKQIGYVPEFPVFPEKYTVKEYLKIIYDMYCPLENSFNSSYDNVIQQCSLENVQDKRISSLSKGFRQRLCFAQAIIHNPENLIFDEPVNGLDPVQIIQFRKMIEKLSAKKTVLISTHLMQEAHSLCDNLFILSNRKIIFSGSETELLSKTQENEIEKAFIKITGNEI